MSIFNLTTTAFSVFDRQHFSTSPHLQPLSSRPVPVTRLVLGPSENRTLRIGFSPDTEQWSHGLLLLRNNLTSLDYVQLQGQSSRGFVTVSGIHPGGPQPLLFEFTKNMMEDCSRVSECKYPGILLSEDLRGFRKMEWLRVYARGGNGTKRASLLGTIRRKSFLRILSKLSSWQHFR